MADYEWRRGDVGPTNDTVLVDRDGTPANLAGATVRFLMRSVCDLSTLVVDGVANIIDAASGIVNYTRSATDTATAGKYVAEYEVTYAGGTVQTFPEGRRDYITVYVTADLG